VIARHFQMNLASAMSDLRSLTVSFRAEHEAEGAPGGYVCELRGRHRDDQEVRIRSVHPEGETAIGNAFARARREVRRRRADGRQRSNAGATATSALFATTDELSPAPGQHHS
jgi:hypothetical protein